MYEIVRLRKIEKAALKVLAVIDKKLDTEIIPFKYICPWGELTKLRKALEINTNSGE